jgi:uncharacterized protein (DUF736 family)
MITLGTFTKTGDAFQGSMICGDLTAHIDIVPVGDGAAVTGMFRVYADGSPIGSGWQARDARGRDYLLVRLVATAESGPITCRLVRDCGDFYALLGPA